jgi:hypothetical protein
VAFYSDKHAVFRINQTGATGGTGLTQFGRALHELNIDILYANSSQAKGRVERMNKTLQDRLVKALRLEGISTLEAANAFLPGFLERFNAKFAKVPASDKDLHRPLTELDDLDEVLCWLAERPHGLEQPDGTVRPRCLVVGANRRHRWATPQEGPGPRLPRRHHHHQVRRCRPALLRLRQGWAGQTGRHRVEQAPRRGA